MASLVKGDEVNIYTDPLTEKDFEGRARIIGIQKIHPEDGVAVCLVQFDDDDPSSRHIRLVNVNQDIEPNIERKGGDYANSNRSKEKI